MKEDFVYSGQENLEAMQEAINYNRYLTNLIISRLEEASISPKKARVLDFGAGIGTFADMVREAGILHVDCLEPDNEQAGILQKKGYTVHKDSKKVKRQYDIIYALNVFEHIEDDITVFREISSLLAPGGEFIVYVPAKQSAFSSMDTLVGHFRRYNLTRLSIMAEQAGLLIRKLEYTEPIGLLAAYAYKMIGNKNGTISKSSVKFYDRFVFPVSHAISPLFAKVGGKNAVLIARKER